MSKSYTVTVNEAKSMPFALPMVGGDGMGTGQPAPNYRPAEDLGKSCDTCAFHDKTNNYCTKFNFKDDPSATCDAWQSIDMNMYDIKMSAKYDPALRERVREMAARRKLPYAEKVAYTKPFVPPLKPIAGPAGDKGGGSQPRQQIQQTRPQTPQTRPQTPQMPPYNPMWRPSVVAQVAGNKGGDDSLIARIQSMFAPKTAEETARHAVGDPLPENWTPLVNIVPPSVVNGGLPSFGKDAWNSVDKYRHSAADKGNYARSWHLKEGGVPSRALIGISAGSLLGGLHSYLTSAKKKKEKESWNRGGLPIQRAYPQSMWGIFQGKLNRSDPKMEALLMQLEKEQEGEVQKDVRETQPADRQPVSR